jgi:uncharacterized protein (DUF1697 family)
MIEAHLRKTLGYDVSTFIRRDAEIAAIARNCPFDDRQVQTAGALNVAFLAEPLTNDAQEKLFELRTEIDEFKVREREVYWLCQVKQSDSSFSNAVFERKLKIPTTFRSWSTLLKLAAKYPSA